LPHEKLRPKKRWARPNEHSRKFPVSASPQTETRRQETDKASGAQGELRLVGPACFAVGFSFSDQGCGGPLARLDIMLLRGRPLRVEFLLLTAQIGLFSLASIIELAERRVRGIKPGTIGRRAFGQALPSVSGINGAKALRLDDKTGSLTPGKEADIIILHATRINVAPLNQVPGAVVSAGFSRSP
jgi:hypothetical protein